MTPQTKRYKAENFLSKENVSSYGNSYLTNEIFVPSEMDKLKKLFPLLEPHVSTIIVHFSQQIEEVLEECDKNCSKAYEKLLVGNIQNTKDE